MGQTWGFVWLQFVLFILISAYGLAYYLFIGSGIIMDKEINKIEGKEKMEQLSLADILNQLGIPISPGEYVKHIKRLDIPLLVVSEPYKTETGNNGIKVKLPDGKEIPVLLSNVVRY